MESYFLFTLLALVAEIIGTVSGFGSSILFVPLAALFYDFKSVLAITAVFHVFSNLSKIFLFRDGIDKHIALKLGIPAVVLVIVGGWLTAYLPVKPLQLLMSCALIGLSLYLLRHFNRKLRQTNLNLYLGGAASGFLAGLTGTGGAVRGITMAAFNLPKNIFIATSALIDLGVDSSRAVIYISNGYFHKQYLVLLPALIIISLVGSYLGKLILRYTSETVFRYLVLSLVIGVSIYQFFQITLK